MTPVAGYFTCTDRAKTMTVGTRTEVWNGKKQTTVGGLTKKDLKKNKSGRIVSKKVSQNAKKKSNLTKFLINPKAKKDKKTKKRDRYGIYLA